MYYSKTNQPAKLKIMKTQLTKIISCLAVLSATTPSLAQSSVEALQAYTGGSTVSFGVAEGRTMGWLFQANSSIQVTALGVYDFGSWAGGWQTSHQVGIWDYSGGLLAETTVTSADPEGADDVRWVTLNSSLNLTAGQFYYIEAYYPNGGAAVTDNLRYQATAVTTSPDITYVCPAWSNDGSFGDPNANQGFGYSNYAYFGPNFQFTAVTVPEPSALSFACLFGLTLLQLRYWKQTADPI
jgi:Domain of unknown function (DUF4082)